MNESGDACVQQFRREHELLPAVLSSVCFAPALIYCFCGCRCVRTVMCVSGLAFGTAVGQLLCVQEPLLEGQARASVSLGVALLAALVAVLVRGVGLFLTGLQLGCLLSGAALLLLGQYYPVLSPAWLPVGLLFGTSVFCAIISLCWRTTMTIAATAALGAVAAMACVDYWVETPMWVFQAYEGLRSRQGLCWYSWMMVGLWPVLGALGMTVQYRITAAAGKQKQLDAMRIRGQTCDRRRSGRSKPPPLRRYAGDVLSPSYLASLRERQAHMGSSLWSLSSLHHTFIDVNAETGSLVPLTASASAVLRL